MFSDDYFMRKALELAKIAFEEDEVPVGAVVVVHQKIIGKGYNQTQKLHDATAHAEMLALTAASNFLASRYLNDCTLYVSLEPCVMCAGALFWTMPKRIVFGAFDTKNGCSKVGKNLYHPKTKVEGGLLENESLDLLQNFFRKLR